MRPMIEEEKARRERLQKLREAGVDPYPSHVERTHQVAEFLSAFEALGVSNTSITLVGRLRLIRKHGGLTFARLEDGSGNVQLAFHKDKLGEAAYESLHATASASARRSFQRFARSWTAKRFWKLKRQLCNPSMAEDSPSHSKRITMRSTRIFTFAFPTRCT